MRLSGTRLIHAPWPIGHKGGRVCAVLHASHVETPWRERTLGATNGPAVRVASILRRGDFNRAFKNVRFDANNANVPLPTVVFGTSFVVSGTSTVVFGTTAGVRVWHLNDHGIATSSRPPHCVSESTSVPSTSKLTRERGTHMIDPLVSLAFTVHANKGTYAVLLGSGVSRAASVMTGWEIVLDLIKKVAATSGETPDPDPAAWYKSKFGREPDYAELLDALAKSPEDRLGLLRGYFEPNEAERAQGLKQPTKAHKAVAKLVAMGYVRVVVTTNFDKLMERALEAVGLTPVVVSSPDGLNGMLPLPHQTCCVVKVHGDYTDHRFKNTPVELATYDTASNKFLDQLFDQFGLIVCGWSAQWDGALRAAIERCPSRRFMTYWAARGEPTEDAKRLVAVRGGVTIPIDDADTFFERVSQMVSGIEASGRSRPDTLEALSALTKRWIMDPQQIVALSDLVHEETERAREIAEKVCEQINRNPDAESWDVWFQRLASAVDRLQVICINGVAWGGPQHVRLWTRMLERMLIPVDRHSLPSGVRYFPAMVLLYSMGLVAIANDKLVTLRPVLYEPFEPGPSESAKRKPLVTTSWWTDAQDFFANVPSVPARARVPRSEFLYKLLRASLRRYLPSDADYNWTFDFLEYLIAMCHLEAAPVIGGRDWAPPGRYSWRLNAVDETPLRTERLRINTTWPPVKAGFFGGEDAKAIALHDRLLAFTAGLQWF